MLLLMGCTTVDRSKYTGDLATLRRRENIILQQTTKGWQAAIRRLNGDDEEENFVSDGEGPAAALIPVTFAQVSIMSSCISLLNFFLFPSRPRPKNPRLHHGFKLTSHSSFKHDLMGNCE